MNTLTKLITELDLKFTSGNSVPVDSVRITHEEYSLLKYHALSHPLGVPSDLEFDEPQTLEELREELKRACLMEFDEVIDHLRTY